MKVVKCLLTLFRTQHAGQEIVTSVKDTEGFCCVWSWLLMEYRILYPGVPASHFGQLLSTQFLGSSSYLWRQFIRAYTVLITAAVRKYINDLAKTYPQYAKLAAPIRDNHLGDLDYFDFHELLSRFKDPSYIIAWTTPVASPGTPLFQPATPQNNPKTNSQNPPWFPPSPNLNSP